MRVAYVYVVGESSETPSARRRYTAVAYDMLAWWTRTAAPCPRACARALAAKLKRHLCATLCGDATGPFRPIRPDRPPSPDTLADLTTDCYVDILRSLDMNDGKKLNRIARSFKTRAARGLIPLPRLEPPKHIDASTVTGGGDDRICDTTVRELASARELADALERTVDGCDLVVVYDACQSEYLSAHTAAARPLHPPTPELRSFLVREGVAPGLPLELACARALADVNVLAGPNLAARVRALATHFGAVPLIEGIARTCDVSVREVVERGISFRCGSVLRSFGYDSGKRRAAVARVTGGLVLEPAHGLLAEPVCAADFSSLYPSIMACLPGAPTEALRACSHALIERRKAEAPPVARACKLVANTLFGQFANRASPLYDPALANRITEEGRRRLVSLKRALEDVGGRVVFGDTDSCMVMFAGLDAAAAEGRAHAILDEFNAALPDPMNMRLQTTLLRSLFLSKKRYMAVDADGRIHYAGTLNRRADVPPMLRDLFRDLAVALLREGGATVAEIVALTRHAYERVHGATPIECAALMRLGRDPSSSSEAECTPVHVALTRRENAHERGLGYRAGDSVEFVACLSRDGRGVPTKVFAAPWDAMAEGSGGRLRLDIEHYWNASAPVVNTFHAAAVDVVSAALGEGAAHEVEGAVRALREPASCAFRDV
jgi:hypothetical protein